MKLRDFIEKNLTEMAEIKADLREHIRRTELLENEVKPLTKIYNFMQGAVAILGAGALVAAIWRTFH